MSEKSKEPRVFAPTRKLALGGAISLLGLAFVLMAWQTVKNAISSPAQVPSGPEINVETRAAVSIFYREKIDPLITAATRQNEEAGNKAIDSFNDRCEEFRKGIGPFTKDLTSYGSQFGILRRKTRDFWDKSWNKKENADSAREYIYRKFEEHIMSEEKLRAALEDTLTQYRQALDAHRNQLLGQIQVAMMTSDAPVQLCVDTDDYKRFTQEIAERVSGTLGDMASASINMRIESEVGGNVAGFVATGAVAAAVTSILTTSAADLSGSALVGGGGGSFAGPAGTIAGVCAGLIVGFAIDAWTSEMAQKKMSDALNKLVDDIQSEITEGKKKTDGLDAAPTIPTGGLRAAFEKSNRLMDETLRNATRNALLARTVS